MQKNKQLDTTPLVMYVLNGLMRSRDDTVINPVIVTRSPARVTVPRAHDRVSSHSSDRAPAVHRGSCATGSEPALAHPDLNNQ